ncbi:hypothetical protein Cri9333_4116 [Crinalium epipsammum PCC 9333]|uniref:Uncharacterized protein n=1 Tax=Crinalium epipsammum PCC 9333 TaxID=1173022 RepID=K9W3I0_9CYAN|nr:hypothetical protein [Crinalium epipsammum]AFZ14913.1 hypothetical protein Cri9333_4116 [Crinalium epipsammum PCC 9333]
MARLSTAELQELIDVHDSFTGVFNSQTESRECVEILQGLGYEVLVPNLTTEKLSGETQNPVIIVNGDIYRYSKPAGFYIAIGGKIEEKDERIISTETKVVPAPSKSDVTDVVNQLKEEGYKVFSPTTQSGSSVSVSEVEITGETEEIIFDESLPFDPPFPKIPSPLKPIPGQEYLWVVVGVKG